MPDFRAIRIRRTATLRFDAPVETLFPLFGPVREAEWAADWQPRIVYAESPLADEAGAIFLTQHPGEPETIWAVARFDAETRQIVYWRITPGLRAAQIEIVCRAVADGSEADVTYTVTSLSEAGSQTLGFYDETHYAAMMRHWEQAIARHLAAE